MTNQGQRNSPRTTNASKTGSRTGTTPPARSPGSLKAAAGMPRTGRFAASSLLPAASSSKLSAADSHHSLGDAKE